MNRVGNVDRTAMKVSSTVDELRDSLVKETPRRNGTSVKEARARFASVQNVVVTNEESLAETIQNL
jgi:hypothetical protein